jgi:hypothetical protein
MRIGAKEYFVNVKKIPYLESFLSFQKHSGQDTTQLPTHDDIPFFDIINDGVERGFRQFFRRMPTELAEYQKLCETLEFLAIDVLEGRKLSDLLKDMRRGKSDYDPEEKTEISAVKSVARDSAFRLLYMFLLGEFESEASASNMAYNCALFVVSHYGIFKSKTRIMVREAYEERFSVTAKQRQSLDQWRRIVDEDREDVTTEEEDSDYMYDSDYSF